MTPKTAKPQTVAEYIAVAPKEAQKKLRELRKAVRDAAPGAEEGLKWSMPSYSYKRILVCFAGYRNHIGFYPTPSAIKAFAKEIAGYKNASGSVQFPLDQPLPVNLIRRMTEFRVQESKQQDVKWRTAPVKSRAKK